MFELTEIEKVSVIINFRDERELISKTVCLLQKISNIKLLGLNSFSTKCELIYDISMRGLGITTDWNLSNSVDYELKKYPIVFVLTPSQLLLYFKDLKGNNYDSIFIGCLMLEQLGVIKRIVK